ncbi:MAG TPA: low specificity L-threonine aldolase [Candidatus Acidoferrales bacterium]|jgi:threonine aldolase|nr:low specificity L-threonine aldolase [Candidatus Acidoferrales bacterium]
MNRNRNFASDNASGICPEAWAAMAEANIGHEIAYGNDTWTQRAADRLREIFETDCEVFFVFNGTSANSLALAHLSQSYQGILCHEVAHIETSECGAPEFFSGGSKIMLLKGAGGKIDPTDIARAMRRRTDVHYPKPRALSLTQATETGTVYSVAEVRTLTEEAKKFGLRVLMDGARFANAVVSLGVSPADITWRAGVDVLSFGGTKNGIAVGEAVVFFNRELAHDFDYRCKQGGQLASKMRFISAPWVGMLKDGAWLRHATHSNAMAQRLEAGLRGIAGVEIAFPVQSNAVLAKISKPAEEQLRQRGWRFSTGGITPGDSRFMCSWDTTTEDIEALVGDLREAVRTA